MSNTTRLRPFGLLAVLALVFTMLLAACGDSTTAAPASSTTAASGTAPASGTTVATSTTAATATTAASGTTVAGTTAATGTTAAAGAPTEVLKFGAPLSLTGSLNEESKQTQQGYEIWRDTINAAGGIKAGGKAYKIELKIVDDESKQDKSAQLAEKLIKEDKVNFLLGPYGTGNTTTVAAVAEKYSIPMVEGNGAALKIFSQGYKYTFGVLSPAPKYLQGAVDLVLAQNPKPNCAVLLSANDSFSVEVADAVQKYAGEKGLEVKSYEKYPDKETNLTAQVTNAKGKSCDVLINSGHYAESVAIIKASKELNFAPKAMFFSVGPALPAFGDNLKKDANYIYGSAQWSKSLTYKGNDPWGTPQGFYDAFTKKFGNDPSYQSASGAACGLAFSTAIEKAGSIDPAKVRDAIAALDFQSFYGQIKFDATGINTVKPMVIEQWQDGQRVTVWPAEAAAAKPQWPAPDWSKR